MQGACFNFRTGFQSGVNRLAFAPDGSLMVGETNRGWGSLGGQTHGLQRVVYTGRAPLEILSMNITPDGWLVKFTKPLDARQAAQPEALVPGVLHLSLLGHVRVAGDRAARKQDRGHRDRRRRALARIVVPQRDERRVYHLQLKDVTAADGAKLLHPDAYYTLNELP